MASNALPPEHEPEHDGVFAKELWKWREETQAETPSAGFTVVLDEVYQALRQMSSILGDDCRWLELPLPNGRLLRIAVWTVPLSINYFKRMVGKEKYVLKFAKDFVSLMPGEGDANVVMALIWNEDCLLGYHGGKRYNWEVPEDGLTDVKHSKAFVS